MSELLGALVLLFGGVGIGFALAKWRHRAALGFALLVLAGVGGVLLLLVPRSQERTICRMLEGIWSKDAHPYELVGAWVGRDTRYPTPFCRLELEEDGTGRCALWHGRSPARLWRVARWDVAGERMEIRLESGERGRRMRGEVHADVLLLEYLEGDDAATPSHWLGPLHLVREKAEEAGRDAIARALEAR